MSHLLGRKSKPNFSPARQPLHQQSYAISTLQYVSFVLSMKKQQRYPIKQYDFIERNRIWNIIKFNFFSIIVLFPFSPSLCTGNMRDLSSRSIYICWTRRLLIAVLERAKEGLLAELKIIHISWEPQWVRPSSQTPPSNGGCTMTTQGLRLLGSSPFVHALPTDIIHRVNSCSDFLESPGDFICNPAWTCHRGEHVSQLNANASHRGFILIQITSQVRTVPRVQFAFTPRQMQFSPLAARFRQV